MLIVCPSCATSYQVDPSSLGGAGRSVRCQRCRKTWFAGDPTAITAIAHAHQNDVASFAARTSVNDYTEGRTEAPALPVVEAAPPTVPADSPLDAADPREEIGQDDRGPAPFAEPTDDRGLMLPPVTESPTFAPDGPIDAAPAPAAAAMPEDIETAALRRSRRQAARKRSRGTMRWTTAILALVAINTGLIAWRGDIVRFLPQTASLYGAIGLPVNLRGVVFADIVTRKEQQDGVQMLVVEGIIKSTSRRNTEVPRLRFAVRNVAGQEIYSWTALPARNVIAPGAAMPFRSRLASPPPEAHAVLVRFFNRRDLVAGLQ